MTTEIEMLYSELIEMIEYPEDVSIDDMKHQLYSLISETIKKPKDAIHIILEIEEERKNLGLCPKCREPIHNEPSLEQSECRGTDCYEVIYTQQCHSCGWNADKD